jgi:hypothetical protein
MIRKSSSVLVLLTIIGDFFLTQGSLLFALTLTWNKEDLEDCGLYTLCFLFFLDHYFSAHYWLLNLLEGLIAFFSLRMQYEYLSPSASLLMMIFCFLVFQLFKFVLFLEQFYFLTASTLVAFIFMFFKFYEIFNRKHPSYLKSVG